MAKNLSLWSLNLRCEYVDYELGTLIQEIPHKRQKKKRGFFVHFSLG
jgi:hypothetical protein